MRGKSRSSMVIARVSAAARSWAKSSSKYSLSRTSLTSSSSGEEIKTTLRPLAVLRVARCFLRNSERWTVSKWGSVKARVVMMDSLYRYYVQLVHLECTIEAAGGQSARKRIAIRVARHFVRHATPGNAATAGRLGRQAGDAATPHSSMCELAFTEVQ